MRGRVRGRGCSWVMPPALRRFRLQLDASSLEDLVMGADVHLDLAGLDGRSALSLHVLIGDREERLGRLELGCERENALPLVIEEIAVEADQGLDRPVRGDG